MRFQGEKLNGWSEKVEIFVTYRSKYLQKNDQNSVFVREALHGEIIFWNNQIFEEGYLSHPKYLGSTVWFNIQLVPKSKICYIVLQILLNLIMAMIVHDSGGRRSGCWHGACPTQPWWSAHQHFVSFQSLWELLKSVSSSKFQDLNKYREEARWLLVLTTSDLQTSFQTSIW